MSITESRITQIGPNVMVRPSNRLVVVLALIMGAFFGAGSESVSAGLQQWNATVDRVLDGDTFEASVDGNQVVVRIAGLQTNETVDNECLAVEATDRLTDLIEGKQVVLRARSESSRSLDRPIRHVFLDGRNVGLLMLNDGHGVPVVFHGEPDFGVDYTRAAFMAARRGVGVWDDDSCGAGPSAGACLEMVTNFDAAGDDSTNINGEYVQLRNTGTEAVDFDGWQIRDEALRRIALPAGTRLEPGGWLRIHVGRGTNTANAVYLNQDVPIFGNEADGVFLYDPDFDIRAWDMWPCSDLCARPGPLMIEHVNFDAPGDDNVNPNGEWVRVRNVGQATIDLQDWMLDIPRAQLTSIASRPIPPGGTVTFYMGSGVNTQTEMYFGLSGGMLSNSNHRVVLYTPDRTVASCDARGTSTCPEIVGGGYPLPQPLGAGRTLRVPVVGVGGVPSSGASAVALNVTAVLPGAAGHLTVWPCGSSRPETSSVNYRPGGVWPNAVVVPVDSTGEVCVWTLAESDVLVDVSAWVGGEAGVAADRLVDTRGSRALGAGRTLRVPVVGVGGVPSSGASAVALNVTAVLPGAAGHLTVWPCGSSRPETSSVNYRPGGVWPNAVVVPVDSTGEVCVWTLAESDVLVDVSAWVGGEAGVAADRLVDTRGSRALGAGRTLRVPVVGVGGVPSSGASAVALNVTAVLPGAAGHLTVWPCGSSRPETSSVNYRPGGVWPNAVVVPVDSTGEVCVWTLAESDVLVDVSAWVGGEVGVAADRLVDTR